MKELSKEHLKQIQTYSLKDRKSIANRKDFGSPACITDSLNKFLQRLPNIYMAKDLRRVTTQMRICRDGKKVLHFALGSHVIKNGLSLYLLDLMKKGFVTTLSFNGSALIHDLEIALVGATSEDVDEGLWDGKFGVAKETAQIIAEATYNGVEQGMGLGKSVGTWILKEAAHGEDSLLAQAVALDIPATVHVAIGTDIVHIHPDFDPEKTALGSYRDFLAFASSVANLEGGMYFNVGSAVILPEVFLKALSLVRNLGNRVENFWAVNLDFIRQYRPGRNVLERPTQKGGQAIELIGPHEILIPLLHAAVVCEI